MGKAVFGKEYGGHRSEGKVAGAKNGAVKNRGMRSRKTRVQDGTTPETALRGGYVRGREVENSHRK